MATRSPSPNLFHRLNQRLAYTRPGAWLYSRTLHHLDRFWLRLTGGKQMLSAILAGLPMMTLTATGAKSGRPRSVPVLGISAGEDIVLIASSFGNAHHPGWYYNLKANPEATLTQAGIRRAYVAREADGEERERLWRLGRQTYAGYDAYKRKARNRKIPVMVLSPKAD